MAEGEAGAECGGDSVRCEELAEDGILGVVCARARVRVWPLGFRRDSLRAGHDACWGWGFVVDLGAERDGKAE
jgi:hypothetical protein